MPGEGHCNVDSGSLRFTCWQARKLRCSRTWRVSIMLHVSLSTSNPLQ